MSAGPMDNVLAANGVRVTVLPGWEAELAELRARPDDVPRSLVHLANFALPAERGDYGSGAVERMDGGGILVILMEFAPERSDAAMFAGREPPAALDPDDFSPRALQRRLPGQAGAQRFFVAAGRPFGLSVVLGAARAAPVLVPEVNRALRGIEIA